MNLGAGTGWRLLTFRALDFDHAHDLSAKDLLRQHPKYPEWLRIVGTEWNLYIATHDLSFSTEAQRTAILRELAREYRPEFKPVVAPDAPRLTTMLPAQAMRTHKE